MLDQARLRELLVYDQDTGDFRWKVSRGRVKAGNLAGSINKRERYNRISVDGVIYFGHRLAWLYMAGSIPLEIDHVDGNRSNNAWSNLRAATRQLNVANVGLRKNNTTGYKGVFRNHNRFLARITCDGKNYHLGNFKTPTEASDAYCKAAKTFFGEFAKIA